MTLTTEFHQFTLFCVQVTTHTHINIQYPVHELYSLDVLNSIWLSLLPLVAKIAHCIQVMLHYLLHPHCTHVDSACTHEIGMTVVGKMRLFDRQEVSYTYTGMGRERGDGEGESGGVGEGVEGEGE